MHPEDFRKKFSMPLSGAGYGLPPYIYRGVQDMFIRFEADAALVWNMLPPDVELPDGRANCAAWARWVPFSAFGPYHEAYIMVEVEFRGTRYLYQPVIVVDNEIPLIAGREIWGYAKKLAVFRRGWEGGRTTFGEQLFYDVQRPRGQPLMRASMVCERKADPEELGEDLPVLSCRLIPSASSAEKPAVAQLVRLDVRSAIRRSADGSPELYAGPAHLELAGGAADPWRLFAPLRIHGGWFVCLDFDLEFGTVVHDYRADPRLWG